jgi:hypothetical protein
MGLRLGKRSIVYSQFSPMDDAQRVAWWSQAARSIRFIGGTVGRVTGGKGCLWPPSPFDER